MEHQNWDKVVFSNKNDSSKNREAQVKKSQHVADVKLEAPPSLGLTILHARTSRGKNQKVLANELGIAASLLSRWENGKEVPNNAQIAKIERVLGVKLPRCKKVKDVGV